MREIVAKRAVGRPKGSTMGIMERIHRFRFAKKCAETNDKVIALWGEHGRGSQVPLGPALGGRATGIELPVNFVALADEVIE